MRAAFETAFAAVLEPGGGALVRYAILSDVHANFESLECALAAIEADDVLVPGRHGRLRPEPQRVRREAARALRARGARQPRSGGAGKLRAWSTSTARPRAAIAWTQRVLDEPSRDWLNTLPYELRFQIFLWCTARRSTTSNTFSTSRPRRRLRADRRTDRLRRPHAHRRILGCDPDGMVEHKHMQHGGELIFEERQTLHRRCRQRRPAARSQSAGSFVRYEPERRRVEWVRYDYPIAEVQRRFARRSFPHIWPIAWRLADE